MGRIRSLLASPRAPWLAALVAVALLSPALGAGYLLDDYSFQFILHPDARAEGFGRADWDLFNFEDGAPAHLRAMRARGTWAWWIAPDFRLAFLRPLSSVMFAWEFRHLPPWAQHLHSLGWYAALVLTTASSSRGARTQATTARRAWERRASPPCSTRR